MSSLSPTDAGDAGNAEYSRMIAGYQPLATSTPTQNKTQTSNTTVKQPDRTQLKTEDTNTNGHYGQLDQLMAESLCPKGTKRETLDTELAPPNLVKVEWRKDKCLSAEWVGKWDDNTEKQIEGIIDLYSVQATDLGTKKDCAPKSQRYRDASARISEVYDVVKESHAQANSTREEIERDIKNDLETLGSYGEEDPCKYQSRYNDLGTGGRGSLLTQARIACSFKNLSLAIAEEEYDQETERLQTEANSLKRTIKDMKTSRRLEKEKKRLKKKIKEIQGSLETEGSQ